MNRNVFKDYLEHRSVDKLEKEMGGFKKEIRFGKTPLLHSKTSIIMCLKLPDNHSNKKYLLDLFGKPIEIV